MVGRRRRSSDSDSVTEVELPDLPPAFGEDEPTANLNEIVAYNFRRAREASGRTQDEVGLLLEPYLGLRLSQAGVSAIERAYAGEKPRQFDAQEILAFALAFDLPLIWFFLPPPDDDRTLQASRLGVNELYVLLLGRDDHLDTLYARFKELGIPQTNEDDEVLERVYGSPTGRSLGDYRRRRKEMLLALLDSQADQVDRSAEEMGKFFDHLRQVGIRGFVAERMMDRDYTLSPVDRGKLPPDPRDLPDGARA